MFSTFLEIKWQNFSHLLSYKYPAAVIPRSSIEKSHIFTISVQFHALIELVLLKLCKILPHYRIWLSSCNKSCSRCEGQPTNAPGVPYRLNKN